MSLCDFQWKAAEYEEARTQVGRPGPQVRCPKGSQHPLLPACVIWAHVSSHSARLAFTYGKQASDTFIPDVSHGQAEDFQKERAVLIPLFVEFFLFRAVLFVFGFLFLKLVL